MFYQQDFQFAELLFFNISFVYILTSRQNNNSQAGTLHQSSEWRLLAFQFESCQPVGNISSPGQTLELQHPDGFRVERERVGSLHSRPPESFTSGARLD